MVVVLCFRLVDGQMHQVMFVKVLEIRKMQSLSEPRLETMVVILNQISL